MKNLFLLSMLTLLPFWGEVLAQLPEKAEDVSPLLVGETFPDVEVKTTEGTAVSFHTIIKEKPTVVIFYRGGWCPYCNSHLAEIGQKEAEILDSGYQIVAISPDKAENLEITAVKDELKYKLYSDGSGALSEAAGIAFKAPERYGKRLLDSSGGENNGYLPVPSVFVLDTNGEIQFEYINPNYKQRLSGNMLTAVLKVLKEEME